MALGSPTYTAAPGGAIDTDATLGATTGIVAGSTPLNATGVGQGDQLGITRNLINTLIQLETFVGQPNSAVTTSLDYRTRKAFYRQFSAQDFFPPASGNAPFQTRNATPILAFPDLVTSTALFIGVIPLGSVLTSGVTVRIKWAAASGTTGSVRWSAAFERMNATIGADAFQTAVAQTTACSGSAGVLVETAITLTALNSAVAGDAFRLQVQRLGADAADTMTVDAQVVMITIENAA